MSRMSGVNGYPVSMSPILSVLISGASLHDGCRLEIEDTFSTH